MIFNTFEPYDIDCSTIESYNTNNLTKKVDKLNNNSHDNINKLFDNENECFICMESHVNKNDYYCDDNYNDFINNSNDNLVELINIQGYRKKCKCNAFIHIYCFNKWISIKCVCPICRMNMEKIINYESKNGIINTNRSIIYNRFEIEYTNNNAYYNYLLLVQVGYYMWCISFFIYLIYYLCIQFELYKI